MTAITVIWIRTWDTDSGFAYRRQTDDRRMGDDIQQTFAENAVLCETAHIFPVACKKQDSALLAK